MLDVGIIVIVISGFVSIMYIFLKGNDRKKIASESNHKKDAAPLRNVKLYSEDGTLLQSYEGVHTVHWDTNIYLLYTEEGGELIVKLDIGANMLLTFEYIREGN